MDFRKLLKELGGKSKEAARGIVKGLSQILTGKTVATPSQVAAAEGVLDSLGTGSGGPLKPPKVRAVPKVSKSSRRRIIENSRKPVAAPIPADETSPEDVIDDFTAGMLQAQMYPVTSSNVHSIGMRIDEPEDRKGTLLIRYLGQGANGQRAGLGSLYEYYDVPTELFREFLSASSKGVFVWDHIRVRGTIAGHRYSYELVGIANGYVPRQVAIKQGQAGQWYIKRKFTDVQLNQGKLVKTQLQSQLPERLVTLRGPNPQRGPGAQALRFNNE